MKPKRSLRSRLNGRMGSNAVTDARLAFAPAALAATGAAAGYTALGPSLGVFVWAFALAALLVPPAAAMRETLTDQAAAVGGVAGVLLLLVLLAATSAGVSIWAATGVGLLLLTAALPLWGLAAALGRLGLDPLYAAAAAVLLGLAWLTWPVWGSTLPGAGGLAGYHPLFAANGLLTDLGIWTERPLAYRLTAFGQDVPYALPSPAAACAVHAAVGAVLLALAHLNWSKQSVSQAGV